MSNSKLSRHALHAFVKYSVLRFRSACAWPWTRRVSRCHRLKLAHGNPDHTDSSPHKSDFSLMSSLTLNQPVVIDLGTATTKAGFAGTPTPSVVLPSAVAYPLLSRSMPPAGPSTSPILGAEIAALSGVVRVSHPLARGAISKPAEAACLVSHVLENELRATQGAHPVLVTENACTPRKNRERLAEMLFEGCSVGSLYVAVPGVLGLYAAGRTTGVVVDVGEGVTTALPVAKGFVAEHAIGRMDLGGGDVTERLGSLLRAGGTSLLASSSEKEAVRKIKESVCEVAREFEDEEEKWQAGGMEVARYELPDGEVVEIGAERYQAPEILFNPAMVGCEKGGVAGLVNDAIMAMDAGVRKELYGTIVLAGGGTLVRGFGQRLVDELRPLPPGNTKIRVHAPKDRALSAYAGGSILASLSTFRTMTFSVGDYWEHGKSGIHRLS